MARVTFELPSLLEPIAAGRRRIELEADTIAAALAALTRDLPALSAQLFDESGQFREHVLCLHNGRNTRWLASLEHPLADGDVLTVMQAVSGG